MMRRRSDRYLLLTGTLIVLMGLAFLHASLRRSGDGSALRQKGQLVRRLGLTDLCLFTDARYCRHPSMADRNTAFQDYPMSFEHFPSGSLLIPPPHLKEKTR
jgi:hypothetical protein